MNAIVVVEDSINNGRLNLVVRDSQFVYNVKRAISATGASTYINNCDFNMNDLNIEEFQLKYKLYKIEKLIYPTLTGSLDNNSDFECIDEECIDEETGETIEFTFREFVALFMDLTVKQTLIVLK